MKWTTKDGHQIEIRDMDDSHLLNTIAMLRRHHRQALEAAWMSLMSLRGEMAIEVAEGQIASMEDLGPIAISDAYPALLAEAAHRELSVPPYSGDLETSEGKLTEKGHRRIMRNAPDQP